MQAVKQHPLWLRIILDGQREKLGRLGALQKASPSFAANFVTGLTQPTLLTYFLVTGPMVKIA
jgi:hypothetical protein